MHRTLAKALQSSCKKETFELNVKDLFENDFVDAAFFISALFVQICLFVSVTMSMTCTENAQANGIRFRLSRQTVLYKCSYKCSRKE